MSARAVFVVGPTASGKTRLAIEIAKNIGGEIICADSRTIYRELTIGTAKPTEGELAEVPHYGIDLVNPDQKFTLHDFIELAKGWMVDIQQRGKIPIIVGGSGLYIDSLLFDYQLGGVGKDTDRLSLQSYSVNELIDYCVKNNIELPENQRNKRYLIRAIEQKGINHRSNRIVQDNVIVVGITTNKNVITQRITDRITNMFGEGVVTEAQTAAHKYGWQVESMTGNIYQAVRDYLAGKLSYEDAIESAVKRDIQLVKKQMTWFRRNPYIVWGSLTELSEYISYRNTRL